MTASPPAYISFFRLHQKSPVALVGKHGTTGCSPITPHTLLQSCVAHPLSSVSKNTRRSRVYCNIDPSRYFIQRLDRLLPSFLLNFILLYIPILFHCASSLLHPVTSFHAKAVEFVVVLSRRIPIWNLILDIISVVILALLLFDIATSLHSHCQISILSPRPKHSTTSLDTSTCYSIL